MAKSRLLLLLLSAVVSVAAFAADTNLLPNPGFELPLKDEWQINDSVSELSADAAHTGKMGLRIGKDGKRPAGSSVQSSRFAVKPGQTFRISFFARAKVANAGAYIWYENAEGKLFQNRPPACNLKAGDGVQWIEHSQEFTVPPEAVNFRLWIHTWSSAAEPSDWDDFAVTGLPEDTVVTPPPPPRRRKPEEPDVDPATVPRPANPPVIILKFDDVKPFRNGIHGRWTRLAEYLERRKIPAGFGVIAEGFESGATEGAKEWFAKRVENGVVSFWCHGWDHRSHGEGKAARNEFTGRSVEENMERLSRCQAVMKREFGITMRTLGPTGGIYGSTIDANALEALARLSDFDIVLYPQPADADSRKYDGNPSLLVLDRVWAVNTESAVGVANFQKFVNGYAKNTTRPYFVLQAHPAAWDDYFFSEFEKIVDFLLERGSEFMTPEQYADRVRAGL